MAPVAITDDYYAILEIPHTAAIEVVRQSYLRLAKARHPDKNLDKPGAKAAFQSLGSAYETISDPEKRKAYDVQWIGIRERQSTKEAEKRQAAAAETQKKRAAEEQAKQDKARQDRLRHLEMRQSGYERDIFEANRVVRRLAVDLKRLQDQDDEDLRKEKEMNSWWTYITSPIYGGQPTETDQQRQERDAERLQRRASKTIKGADWAQQEDRLKSLKDALQQVDNDIAAEKKKAEDEARLQAAKRQQQFFKEQEARRRAEEELEKSRREKQAKEQAKEQAARAAKFYEAWQAQERVWKAAEEQRKATEAEEQRKAAEAEERRKAAKAEERAARAAEAARNTKRSSYRASASASASGSARTRSNNTTQQCNHKQFWPKVEGRQLCGNCNHFQKQFAFQCPGCGIIACASCRQTLRGEDTTRKGAKRAGNHHRSGPFGRDGTNAANRGNHFSDYGGNGSFEYGGNDIFEHGGNDFFEYDNYDD